MKKIVWAPLLLALAVSPALADTAEELDAWFRDGYAALYVENAWDHADEFAQYFSSEIAYRSNDGLAVADVNGFLIDSIEGWRSEGWVGTDVASLSTKILNDTTAVFDIKWQDRDANGVTGFECGWYFADKIEGKWLLSQYIVMECSD